MDNNHSLLDNEQINQAVTAMLAMGVLTVQFTKKDGTTRVMRCTTCPSIVVPHEKTTDRVKKPSNSTKSVWDVEKEAWRTIPFGYGNGLKLIQWQVYSMAVREAEPNSVQHNEGAMLD